MHDTLHVHDTHHVHDRHLVQVHADTVDVDDDEEETCLEEIAVCYAVSFAVVEEFGHQ